MHEEPDLDWFGIIQNCKVQNFTVIQFSLFVSIQPSEIKSSGAAMKGNISFNTCDPF